MTNRFSLPDLAEVDFRLLANPAAPHEPIAALSAAIQAQTFGPAEPYRADPALPNPGRFGQCGRKTCSESTRSAASGAGTARKRARPSVARRLAAAVLHELLRADEAERRDEQHAPEHVASSVAPDQPSPLR